VSGDFYWATRKAEWLVVSVADCTGHGVPGSLMSMLGISFLNEIVLNNNLIDPGKILTILRSYVVGALRQTGDGVTHGDGMDMSILAINTKTKECIWAGANNPLWIVRNTENNQQLRVEEIKPDLMPVATHIRMDNFKSHQIQLNHGDRLFLFSDGYPDQFGGPENKKFNMHGAFRELIATTSSLPIREQGKLLEANFDKWMSYNGPKADQTDDVTILGITV
jgi:serine phosphatase RsbU (regulator of sigma subunit)